MTVITLQSTISAFQSAGIVLSLTSDKRISVQPASKLTPELRGLIRDCRAELLDWLEAANDPDKPWNVTLRPGISPETLAKFRAASLALDAQQAKTGDVDQDPDRHCWPHSDAMTTAEIDRFSVRLLAFIGKGVADQEAEALADKLVKRDRDGDDRRICLECVHCAHGRCNQWRAADLGQSEIPIGVTTQLQRCGGFTPWA